MSIAATNAAKAEIEAQKTSLVQQLILMQMGIDHKKNQPLIFGIREFARAHHLSDSGARKAVGELLEKGIICRVEQPGCNKGRKAQFEMRGVHFGRSPIAPGSKPRPKPDLRAIEGGRYARQSE
jgi:hypothetical protein